MVIRKIRILHISAAGTYTGAGRAALKLHLSLLRHDIDSRMLFLMNNSDESQGVFSFTDTVYRRILRLVVTTLDRVPTWSYLNRKKQIFSPGFLGLSLRSHPMVEWADIINLHWVNHGFVRISELRKINKPIIWTMHDMWIFTGGCYYSFWCEKFNSSCGKCPVLGSSWEKDLSYWVLRNKQRSLPAEKIKWIAVSSWIADLVAKSILLKKTSINIIYSGIDTNIFMPKDKYRARKDLKLPSDKIIILLGADNLLSPYKGIQFSLDALRLLNNEYVVVTFGNGKLLKDQLNQTVIHMGFIDDPQKLASLYSAADLFLATSIAEAFGMTVAEAQCCGIPVVAFNSLGPKDILEHKVTGYLAEMESVSDVTEGINYCLSAKFDYEKIRKRAVDLFSIDNCSIKYIELYRASLKENPQFQRI